MSKLTLLLMEFFILRMKEIDFDWKLLSDDEQELFENEQTFNVIVKEAKIRFNL